VTRRQATGLTEPDKSIAALPQLGALGSTIKTKIRSLLPREIGPHRIWSGPLRGRTIVTSWHDYPRAIVGRTETRLLRLLQTRVADGETWLDIGAQYGYTVIAMHRAKRVYAFEPVPTTAIALETTVRLNGLTNTAIVPIGLSDQAGETSVSLVKGMADHVARTPEKVDITLARLDDLWPDLDGGPIHGLKMDIQGAETKALNGMASLLVKYQPWLAIEIHDGTDPGVLTNLLAGWGYGAGTPLDPEVAPFTPNHSVIFQSRTAAS